MKKGVGDLFKGQRGDWKKEGYSIKEGKSSDHYVIEAHHPEHGLVGKAHFKANASGTKLIPVHTVVKPEHQRKGLATAMYQHAEKIHQTPIANKASHQTPAAQELWSQPNRPFGNKVKKIQSMGRAINSLTKAERTYTHDEVDEHFKQVSGGDQFYTGGKEGAFGSGGPKPNHTKLGLPHGTYEKKMIPVHHINSHSQHENPTMPLGYEENEVWARKYAQMDSEAPAIIVKPHPHKPGHYQTMDGVHRARAAYLKGKTHIPAFVHVSHELKKGDLFKGAMKRVAPFNPSKDIQPDDKGALRAWQTYGNDTHEGQMLDARHMPSVRRGLSELHDNAKLRGMNKLMSRAQWRRNPHSNELEFLLHRGMTKEEHDTRIRPSGSHIQYTHRTSWMPDLDRARSYSDPEFASSGREDHGIETEGPGMTVSAWIPASRIAHMPFMAGAVERHTSKGENEYAEENEVITHPHTFEVHKRYIQKTGKKSK